jgi:hypothetical protein
MDKKRMIEENYDEEEISYQEFVCDRRPFSWETKQEELSFESFPTRLYNIRTSEVEKTEVDSYIKKYATLSYVWGDLSDKSLLTTWDYSYQNEDGKIEPKQLGVSPKDGAHGTTKWSIKALKKTQAAIDFLNEEHNANIGYLWMDQLCIDQFNNEEQN